MLPMAKVSVRYESVGLSPFGDSSQPGDPAKDIDQHSPLGIRSTKGHLSRRDLLAVSIQLTGFLASIVIVAATSVARYVGQINQLVALGLLLTVVGKAFQGRLSTLLLCLEVRSGARLQNLDAILRTDALFDNISLRIRAVLLAVYLVPLVLSASYKQFVGGTMSYHLDSYEPLLFGLVGPPGLQKIGNGLGLMINASLPFFLEPKIGVAYGFNIYSFKNSTMYFLDGPMPDSVHHIQKELREGDVFQFDARVAGNVAYDAPVPQPMRTSNDSSDFISIASFLDQPGYQAYDIPLYPGTFSLLVRQNNCSDVYVSVWHGVSSNIVLEDAGHAERDGILGQNLRHVKIERRWCHGTWGVSKTTASLLHATCEEQTDLHQRLLQKNFLTIDSFSSQINEFITHPVDQGRSNPQQIDLVVPAIGATVWSRATALDGPADWSDLYDVTKVGLQTNVSMTFYPSPLSAISISSPALRRHWSLFLILTFYPLGTLVIIVVRATVFYETAIDQNFGLMTLIAGSSPENQELLRGASLSGTATKPVPIRFVVETNVDSGPSYGRITYEVGKVGQIGKIKKHVYYE